MNDDDVVSVWVSVGRQHTLLANLSRNVSQCQIDVAFGNQEMPEFYLRAAIPATVYLSGYYIIDDDNESDNAGESSYITGKKSNYQVKR